MRISKDPEVRKQEMLDTAMKLFAEKGYEATTMSDIAKAMHVVPGLCYNYFRSKHELYQTAMQQYAKECSKPMLEILVKDETELETYLNQFAKHFIATEGREKYHSFFHEKGNENKVGHTHYQNSNTPIGIIFLFYSSCHPEIFPAVLGIARNHC